MAVRVDPPAIVPRAGPRRCPRHGLGGEPVTATDVSIARGRLRSRPRRGPARHRGRQADGTPSAEGLTIGARRENRRHLERDPLDFAVVRRARRGRGGRPPPSIAGSRRSAIAPASPHRRTARPKLVKVSSCGRRDASGGPRDLAPPPPGELHQDLAQGLATSEACARRRSAALVPSAG